MASKRRIRDDLGDVEARRRDRRRRSACSRPLAIVCTGPARPPLGPRTRRPCRRCGCRRRRRSCRRRCGRAPSAARSARRRSAPRCESPRAGGACRAAPRPAPERAAGQGKGEQRSGAGRAPRGPPTRPGRDRKAGHRQRSTNENPRGYQRLRTIASMSPAGRPTLAPAATISPQVTASTGTPVGQPRRPHLALRLAGDLHAVHARRRAAMRCSRRRTISISRARLAAVPSLFGSTMIENMLLRTLRRPSVTGPRGGAAGERAAEQLADQRQARALVLAERQQRAERLDHGVARVGGRLAVVVDDRAGRERDALVVGDAGLALGDLAGGEVEHDRLLARARDADAERIGAEARIAAAERRDDRPRQHVDEMDRDQARARCTARPSGRCGRGGANAPGRRRRRRAACARSMPSSIAS